MGMLGTRLITSRTPSVSAVGVRRGATPTEVWARAHPDTMNAPASNSAGRRHLRAPRQSTLRDILIE